MEKQEIKNKVLELRQKYTRLALNCRAAGIKVNPETVAEYAKEIRALEKQLIS